MTSKIFRSTLLVAVVVLLCSLGVVMWVLYNHFTGVQIQQLKNELSLAVTGTEQYGNAFLENVEAERFFCFPGMSAKLEKGDILSFAVIFTDQYGRQGVESSLPAFECFGEEISWTDDSDGTPFFDIQNYTY